MIEELREMRGGFTQKEMARLLKISQTYYSQLEHGQRSPSMALIRRMSEVLNVTADCLISWWPDEEPARSRITDSRMGA
jgi:transcriptional regulator with XRE-family HTH domain